MFDNVFLVVAVELSYSYTGYKKVVAQQTLISSQGLYSDPQDNTKELTGLYIQAEMKSLFAVTAILVITFAMATEELNQDVELRKYHICIRTRGPICIYSLLIVMHACVYSMTRVLLSCRYFKFHKVYVADRPYCVALAHYINYKCIIVRWPVGFC